MRNTTWQDETVQALKQGYQEVIAAKDAELAALRQERDELRAVVEAARKLQVKMLRVYNTPEYQTVWSIAQSHVGKYEGGNWIDEFDELAAELARVDGEK